MPLVLERSWVGRRVSIRRVVARADDGRLLFGDVVGDLLGLDDAAALVESRDGLVEVVLAQVARARLVLASAADELGLEAIAARGWRPAETGAVGGWVLRAAQGFTGRANSVLPLRAPGLPLDEALAAASTWYAARDLPLRVQVPVESRRLLDAGLAEQGWPAEPDVHVMVGRLDVLSAGTGAARSTATGPAVGIDTVPDGGWLGCYRGGAGASQAARDLLVRHDRVGFASIRRGPQVLAIGRGAVDDAWLGITAVEVVAEHRRQGLAAAVMSALWEWGRAHGATRSYLQVSSDNAAACARYETLGYWRHHDYHYRIDPSPAAVSAGQEALVAANRAPFTDAADGGPAGQRR